MVQAVKAGDKKKETIGADIKKTGQPDYKLLIDTAALAGTIMLECRGNDKLYTKNLRS